MATNVVQNPQNEEFAHLNTNHDNNSTTNNYLYQDLLADPDFAQIAYGRMETLYQMMQILIRKKKPNVIILGEPGVGKSHLIQGLAYCFQNQNVIKELKNHRLLKLDLNSLKSGAANAGTIEQKLIELEQMIKSSSEPIIFFIDEIHQLMNSSIHNQAIINFLKPHLTTNFIRIVGATTNSEYQKYFLKDQAMVRRFQTLVLEPIDQDACFNLLKTMIANQYPNVQISNDDLKYLISLCCRYLTNRQLPDSAIDAFDQAFSLARLKDQPLEKLLINEQIINAKKINAPLATINDLKTKLITYEPEMEIDLLKTDQRQMKMRLALLINRDHQDHSEIKQLAHDLINLNQKLKTKSAQIVKPKQTVITIDRLIIDQVITTLSQVAINRYETNYQHLQTVLKQIIIGQNDVIEAISNQLLPYFLNLHQPQRPIASFLFCGPSGVGKTECAKAIATAIFNNPNKFLKIDMSEFKEAHSISKLIGTGAGYVGYGEQNQLASFVMSHPHSVILFDEIDKAHPNILNLLLQILDEGILTDGQNNKINFKNTIIVMSANWTSEQSNLAGKDLKTELLKVIKPELINRIDQILQFKPLTIANLVQISQSECNDWKTKIANQYQVELQFNENVYNYFANQGYDPHFGARFLKQIVMQELLLLIAPVLQDHHQGQKICKINVQDHKLIIENQTGS